MLKQIYYTFDIYGSPISITLALIGLTLQVSRSLKLFAVN